MSTFLSHQSVSEMRQLRSSGVNHENIYWHVSYIDAVDYSTIEANRKTFFYYIGGVIQ